METRRKRYLRNWNDHPCNPLISPPFPEFLIGDPALITPDESPDGNWHLFANSLLGIHHYTGDDGVHWKRERKLFPGMRAFIFREGDIYHLLCEEFTVPAIRSRIVRHSSVDLKNWTRSRIILEPSLNWECKAKIVRTCGNPCLIRTKSGNLRLYYSANLAFLPDLGFCEPLFIGVAEAPDIDGPYEKLTEPIISPSKENPYRNLAAGAMKVIYDDGMNLYFGFNNGIYKDDHGKTRSAILLLSSTDGINWSELYPEPIIAPAGSGWKKALVYQLDVKRVGNEMWLWYNARSGWRIGRERIGLAISKDL